MKYLSYRTSRLLFAYRMAKQVQIIWLLMIRRFSTASRNNCHCVGVTRLKHWYCWEIWKNSRLEFDASVLLSFARLCDLPKHRLTSQLFRRLLNLEVDNSFQQGFRLKIQTLFICCFVSFNDFHWTFICNIFWNS